EPPLASSDGLHPVEQGTLNQVHETLAGEPSHWSVRGGSTACGRATEVRALLSEPQTSLSRTRGLRSRFCRGPGSIHDFIRPRIGTPAPSRVRNALKIPRGETKPKESSHERAYV